MYTVHFLAGERDVAEDERFCIEGAVGAVYERVRTMLDLEECDILFCFNTKRMIDGEMFRESLNDEISCYMFADSEKVAQTMKSDQQLVARACAEHLYAGLYSTARIRHTGVGADCGLLEEVVNEGLAAHFMGEMGDGTAKGYYLSLSPDVCEKLREQLLWECADGSVTIEKWFRGSGEEGIPALAALSVGFFIVAEYLEKVGKKSTDVLRMPADEFVK